MIKKLSLIVCLVAIATSSFASTGLQGFNLQTFRPPSDGSGTFNLTGSKTRGHLRPHFGLISNVAGSLLSAGNPVNNEATKIVNTLFTTDFSASMGFAKFINIGIDVPVVFFENGRNYNTTNYFKTATMGDLRADVKFKIIDGIALLSSVSFPTGSRSKFTGTDGVSYNGKLILDKDFGRLYVDTNIGYLAMKGTTVAETDIDDQLTYGLGAVYVLPVWNDSLSIIGEVFGATVIKSVKKKTSSLEALGGIRKKFASGLSFEIAGGREIIDAIGSPNYRAVAGLTYDLPISRIKKSYKTAMEFPSKTGKEMIRFDFDSAKIKPELAHTLDNIKSAKKIIVSGYADSAGPENHNLVLSKMRALAVKKYLESRLGNDVEIILRSFGSANPVATNSTKEGRAQNRRVEIEAE